MIPIVTGRNATSGRQRAVAEDVLDVERGEEEHSEHAGEHAQKRGVADDQGTDAQDAQPHQRRVTAALDGDERGQQHERRAAESQGACRTPAVGLRLDDRVHKHDQPAGDRGRAGKVIGAACAVQSRLGHVAQRQHDRGQADRHVDEEIHRQEARSVSAPPTRSPTAGPH
jgi:hypothetical protein